MAVIFLVFEFFGDEILYLWLKRDAESQSVEILKILGFGLIPYAIGTLCVSLLHAFGRTEVTAKLNMIEFPIFLCLIFFSVKYFGILGAAYAWVIRVIIDAIAVFILAKREK